jgi:iron complex outermembrane receptor protein
MMLNEMGGMRVQATSPSLGAASVRIQGMRGRYTRVFSDGLPLFGGQVGGLGLLQIPPMDLGQVEVIKGVASALYGAGAMGGIINLVSRRAGDETEVEALVNRSSRGATDTVAWIASPGSRRWSASLLAGGYWQDQADVDDDGWADLAGYSRAVARPRVSFDNGRGTTVFATAGMTVEERRGGTSDDGPAIPWLTGGYVEALDTTTLDGGVVVQSVVADRFVLTGRGAFARQRHDHRFGELRERDRHVTSFGEIAVRGASGVHTWVAGGAIEQQRYTPRDVPRFAYRETVPGVFAQDDVALFAWLTISAGVRVDDAGAYGMRASPRVSALIRRGRWASRGSWGTGFTIPTPLVEESEAAGLTRLVVPVPLAIERGQSASFDLTRTAGPLSTTVTVFGSRVADPLLVLRTSEFQLVNAPEPTTNVGVELLAIVRRAPFAATATYTYVRARQWEPDSSSGARRSVDVPLTPRHGVGLVAMAEDEAVGRIGVELYFTGRQRLDDNPYREASPAYALVGVLAERRFGRLRLFVNGENLTNVRQTHWDPLLRPMRAVDGRWTVDAWAPLDGRTVNGGVRVGF